MSGPAVAERARTDMTESVCVGVKGERISSSENGSVDIFFKMEEF